jgi:hypothetical protein
MDLYAEQTSKGDWAYPAYAWPGGYPIYYLTADAGTLCPDCANGKNSSEAGSKHDDKQWRLVAMDVHYEGEPIQCDHCGGVMESAYGIPE